MVRLHRKNDGIIWEFFPNVGPPLPPFWEPVFPKKIWFILHFRPLGAFLVFTNMFTFWSILFLGIGDPLKKSLFLLLGIGDPPKTPCFYFWE